MTEMRDDREGGALLKLHHHCKTGLEDQEKGAKLIFNLEQYETAWLSTDRIVKVVFILKPKSRCIFTLN